jgi:pimeloyl-ACP methyl ester carboxylesterase
MASVNGATLTFLEQGTGAPVLFLHGAITDLRMWEGQRETVAAKYRFIALSMRYFGTAPWPDDGAHFSEATHVADIAAFIRMLEAGPVYLVGHSYGSRLALAITFQHPELVRGLFLNEPGLISAVTDPAEREAAVEDRQAGLAPLQAILPTGDATEIARRWSEFSNGAPGAFDSLPAASQTMLVENARTVRLQLSPRVAVNLSCEELGRLRVPVAITKGELTRKFFQITVEAVARCVPGAKLITISGARHRAPMQNSTAFNEALLSYLARH